MSTVTESTPVHMGMANYEAQTLAALCSVDDVFVISASLTPDQVERLGAEDFTVHFGVFSVTNLRSAVDCPRCLEWMHA